MAAYIDNENVYRELIRDFLSQQIDAIIFVEKFIAQWKHDRDKQFEEINKGIEPSETEEELSDKLLDQIFTACDCYNPKPEEKYELNDEQLFIEVKKLASNYWGRV